MGYILAEGFTLLAVISFTKAILYLRRGRGQHRFLSRADREIFFRPIRLPASAAKRIARYGITSFLVLMAAAIEILILSSCGAAIVTGALLVTSLAIVQNGLNES